MGACTPEELANTTDQGFPLESLLLNIDQHTTGIQRMGRGGFAMPGLWDALVGCPSRTRVEQGDPFSSSPRERTTVLVWESHISKISVTLVRSPHLSELHL